MKNDGYTKLKVSDFDLEQTLECGQCFNFEKTGTEEYIVVAAERMLHIKQEGNELLFLNASQDDVRKIWIPYFDLERDYGKIKRELVKADSRLEPVIKENSGIRILNQDFCETLISFIISQNKNIPHIKRIVRKISEKNAHEIGRMRLDEPGDAERIYYAFPKLSKLCEFSEEDFKELKTGFRAPYLCDAINKMKDGSINEKELRRVSFEEAKQKLMTIKGVGDKVANCVLLFGLGFRNAFPVDVWIKRIMEEMYFHEPTDKKIIEKFAAEKFGEYGGYAQQYLFIYAKGGNLGK